VASHVLNFKLFMYMRLVLKQYFIYTFSKITLIKDDIINLEKPR